VLVKRNVREVGSGQARQLLRHHRLLSYAIAPLEAMSAFSRRQAAGELSARNFSAITSRLRADQGHWELVEVSAGVLTRAEEVIVKAKVRTLDALHVAAASLSKNFQDCGCHSSRLMSSGGRPRNNSVSRSSGSSRVGACLRSPMI
jgi:predicted nucleic acid-binding protein